MFGYINRATLMGNLGADPESVRTGAGKLIVKFRMATSVFWRDEAGERKQRTEWHNVVIYNETLAKTAEKLLKKGSKVYVEGELRTREYEQNGQKRYVTEVVIQGFGSQLEVLDFRPGADQSRQQGSDDDYNGYGSGSYQDDGIPF